jgi:hypothetical protein
MEVLVDGRIVPEHWKGDRAYVEALRGREYSIRLSNDSGGRVAVALHVDGLNTIDASHGSALQSPKWVLGPWEQISVDGWQVGSGTARRFIFTTEEKSYGAWLGETRNLGLVSAVFFRERPYEPPCEDPQPWTYGPWQDERRYDGYGGSRIEAPRDDASDGDEGGGFWDRLFGSNDETEAKGKREESSARRDAPAEPRASAQAESGSPRAGGGAGAVGSGPSSGSSSGYHSGAEGRSSADASAPARESSRGRWQPQPEPDRAATGTGRRVEHRVEWVDFDLDPTPVASLDIRYGFRDELISLGVLPAPRRYDDLARRESSSGFAPDPGYSCCRD